jgi:competence protein ComEC
MSIQSKETRFRAYQLGSPGASFSYYDGSRFTLIEARYTDANCDSIEQEIRECGVDNVHTLHITSWDQDHCVAGQLEEILERYTPYKIEYPGYRPHTDSGIECQKIIKAYEASKGKSSKIIQVTPAYIDSLNSAKNYGYNDVFYNPRTIDAGSSNNNSTVKHFRTGSFNLLSLGDVESTQISSSVRRSSTVNKETDIMLLAHHGADNGFTTSSFLRMVKPTVAIASADYANKFEHPKKEIRDLLNKHRIKLFTTKTGDVISYSTGNHTGNYRVVNLKSGSSDVSSYIDLKSRKNHRVNVNDDVIRARLKGTNRGPKKR